MYCIVSRETQNSLTELKDLILRLQLHSMPLNANGKTNNHDAVLFKVK